MIVRTGVLVDVYNQKIESFILKAKTYKELNVQIKKMLNTDWLDSKFVNFSGISCCCFFDDIGKVRSDIKYIPSIVLVNKDTNKIVDWISGNVWIEGYDGGEDTRSLNSKEIIRLITLCFTTVSFSNSSEKFNVLKSVDTWVDITELMESN